MFFKKKVPEPPPISDEVAYIAWFIEHSEKIAPLRALNSHNLPAFVAACVKGSMKEVSKLTDGDAMFARAGDLAVAYETQVKPLVDKHGGLHKCPGDLYGAAVSILVNILVLSEMLKTKYKHPEAIAFFNRIKTGL